MAATATATAEALALALALSLLQTNNKEQQYVTSSFCLSRQLTTGGSM